MDNTRPSASDFYSRTYIDTNKYSEQVISSNVPNMPHSSTPKAFLSAARSTSSAPSLRAFTRPPCRPRLHIAFRRSLPSSRRLHDHPASHLPRGDHPPPISTVNDAEIAHFSRLSALWWDERGEFALLHKMNRHRIRFIREKVLEMRRDEQLDVDSRAATATRSMESSRVLEGMDVLDVGCGGGILSEVCFHFISYPPIRLNTLLSSSLSPYLCPHVIDDAYRASRVSARTRSPSTRQGKTSVSRHATPPPTRASRRCRSVMRRLRRLYRRRSDSMSSVRWRLWSMWTTRVPFCGPAPNSSRYVSYLLPSIPQYNDFLVGSSLAVTFFFRRSHGHRSLTSLRS
jgi:hypothetical protein